MDLKHLYKQKSKKQKQKRTIEEFYASCYNMTDWLTELFDLRNISYILLYWNNETNLTL